MIENRVLNYFLVIAREQNMTKASRQLHITQSTLSKQMADLEAQLGIKLFKRTNKSTLLTEDGIMFRTRAQEMIDMMNKLESEFSTEAGTISGDIYLGCGETHIMRPISTLFKEIQTKYPDVHFHIYSADAYSVMERLDKGLLDIGLLLGPTKEEKYTYQKLAFHDTFGILMPGDSELTKKDVLTLEDIRNLPLIISAQSAAGSHNLSWFQDEMENLNITCTYNLITNATYMVEEGLGYALCLCNLVNTEGRNLAFRPVTPELKIDSYIVTKKYVHQSKATRLLLKLIEERIVE